MFRGNLCRQHPVCLLSDIHARVQIHAVQQNYNESCIFNSVFSSSHIKKCKKKNVKSVFFFFRFLFFGYYFLNLFWGEVSFNIYCLT